MSISTVFKEFSAVCKVSLEKLPEEIRKDATLVVNRKIEAVRSKCYSDKSYLDSGKKTVESVIRNIYIVTGEKEKQFPTIPKAVLVQSFELFLDETTDVDNVVVRLANIQNSVFLPTMRIDAFPEIVRCFIRNAATKVVESVRGVAEPVLYNSALNDELCRWEAKKEQIVSLLNEFEPYLTEGLDPSAFIGALFKTFDRQAQRSDIFDLFKNFLLGRTKLQCIYELSSVLAYTYPTDVPISDSVKQNIDNVKAYLFDRVIRPSTHLAFCLALAKKKFNFPQLLAVYEEFERRWQVECKPPVAECTLDKAKRILGCIDSIDDAKVDAEQSLVPVLKTKVCVDTRGFGIHLKPVKEDLYRVIPLSTKTGDRYYEDGAKSVYKADGKLFNETILFDVCARQGRRETMEDAHLITTITLQDGQEVVECPFFAIMDGHGGRVVADLLEMTLAPTVTTWLNAALQENNESDANIDAAFRNALKIGMIKLNALFKNIIETPLILGSCCIFSFIYKNRLFTVNVGDSRAVTSTGEQLSIDADKSSPEYVKKIKKRSGVVDKQGRVDGLLTFSSFGTFDNPFIRAFTGIHVLKLKPAENDQKMKLLLVCDGITARFTSAALIDGLNNGRTANEIVDFAYKNGAEDNLSAIRVEIPYSIVGAL